MNPLREAAGAHRYRDFRVRSSNAVLGFWIRLGVPRQGVSDNSGRRGQRHRRVGIRRRRGRPGEDTLPLGRCGRLPRGPLFRSPSAWSAAVRRQPPSGTAAVPVADGVAVGINIGVRLRMTHI